MHVRERSIDTYQTKFADLVQIVPEDFSKDAAQAIEDNINAKYANKVIQKIGLCICLFDLLMASEGLIGHGTGLVNVNVEFRLVVFRPFKNEVILGKISSSNLHGIRIRLPFFDEIFVPKDKLPEPCEFKHNEQIYVWQASPDFPLYFDKHEIVRVRIESEIWTDQTPVGPKDKEDTNVVVTSPYALQGSMQEAGLGPCIWWDDADDNDAVEDES
ncbi:DNA-directed RNA polymerase III subunit rpc8 [Golovinomyces cichoracearum]|uniref:DNA-directed RNA polymerase subunit n=1 Tax=Golovinomyces cichoracearum TaxID=62708 RepID=A0A420HHV5_9PEZI|nr:DNA-directed RNA polymerase III subunit rpc8 [Golovinomyces cichoracearum]